MSDNSNQNSQRQSINSDPRAELIEISNAVRQSKNFGKNEAVILLLEELLNEQQGNIN